MAYGRKTGGRQKGTPNKKTVAVKDALTQAFDEMGGVPALVEWGKSEPGEFYKLWARMLPRDLKHDIPEKSPIAELVQQVSGNVLQPRQPMEDEPDDRNQGNESARVHRGHLRQ